MSIEAWSNWNCPHCKNANRFEEVYSYNGTNISNLKTLCNTSIQNSYNHIVICRCTSCWKIIILINDQMIYPLWAQRNSAPQEVPYEIAQDFNEACLVESLSSKAASALWRRCLQNIFHEQGIKKKDLNQEIEEAIKTLPSHLSDAIDAIRNIWNFSAHPMKYTQTWDIVEVEEWETEWVLDTLEWLFDFYYVAPAKLKSKRDTLNIKLTAAWKPNLK
jgi:hypothetical protein